MESCCATGNWPELACAAAFGSSKAEVWGHGAWYDAFDVGGSRVPLKESQVFHGGHAWWEGKPAAVLHTHQGALKGARILVRDRTLPQRRHVHGRLRDLPIVPPQGCSLSPPHDHEGIGEDALEVAMKVGLGGGTMVAFGLAIAPAFFTAALPCCAT